MRTLDLNRLKSRKADKVLSTEESLRDITPMEWPEDVITGKKKVEITSADKCSETEVRVKIKYV